MLNSGFATRTRQELIERKKNAYKLPGVQSWPVAPMCHDGFPGNFNMSYCEYELIQSQGQLLNVRQDLAMSKVQPCIRMNDLDTIINRGERHEQYLALFEMSDIAGVTVQKHADREAGTMHAIVLGVMDFFASVGLDTSLLRVSYFAGGSVALATAGKYGFEHAIEPDPLVEQWLDCGLSESQLIPDQTRATFLALNSFGRPTPWGYRNEIYYLHNGKLLDIATIEILQFAPVFQDGQIVSLRPWGSLACGSVCGVERMLMAINAHTSVLECPHIIPLVERIDSLARGRSPEHAEILAQVLRPLHRLAAECREFSLLSRRRRKRLQPLLRAVREECRILELADDCALFRELLIVNAQYQPYFLELAASVDSAAEQIARVARQVSLIVSEQPCLS
jgi:hypothetical protein